MRLKCLLSSFLAIIMLLSLLAIPVAAAGDNITIEDTHILPISDTAPSPSVEITTAAVTERTTELTIRLSNLPASGILRIIELDAGAEYESDKLNDYHSLFFSIVGNLTDGTNTLTLTAKPTAGKQVMAVIRDSAADPMQDYTSASVTVGSEQGPSIVAIANQSVTNAAETVTLHFTRIPDSGLVKIIQLDAGESYDAENLISYDAVYTAYFFSAGLQVGDNPVALTKAPTAGKVLYVVARDFSGESYVDYISEGVPVTVASADFTVRIKGALTNQSETVQFLPEAKNAAQSSIPIEKALLCRMSEDGAAALDAPVAQADNQKAGQLITFSGISGLTAGETLCVVLQYDEGKTFTSEAFVVCDTDVSDSFRIVEESFTTESTTVTVEVTGYNWYNNRGNWCKIWITTGDANQTEPGDDEGREDLASQTFTGSGTYTFTIDSSALEAGNSIMAAIRFYDADGLEGKVDWEWYAAADTVLISSAGTPGKSWQEVLGNCSVNILKDGKPRTEAVKQEQTTLDYAVQLDDTISSARLAIYTYPGTVSFDPDSNITRRFAGKDVTNGDSGTLSVDLTEIPVGYKVVAGLYVCLDGNDFYRTVASPQVLEVVDENGEGFQDYVYPDASIDEIALQAGATSLHISLTGDERIFAAAKEGKLNLTVAVSQYPDGEAFDFEGANQISLLSNYSATEAFSGKEITLAEPLRAGYRVRAVVYWTQNVDLFIPKGNDYEDVFQRPDDSVLISSPAAVSLPEAVLDTDSIVSVTVSGDVSDGAVLLLKSFDSGDEIAQTGEHGSRQDLT